jgi:hypothetical protein
MWLQPNRSYCMGAGVSGYYNWFCLVKQLKNRAVAQTVFEVLVKILTFFDPLEGMAITLANSKLGSNT